MSRTTILLIGTGAIIAVAIGILAYAYRPTAAVERAVAGLGQAKTANVRAVVLLENSQATQQLLGEEGAIEITIDGALVRRDNQQDNLAADINLTTKTESVTVNLDGEVRMIDDRVYIYIDKAPKVFPALVALKQQWLIIDRGGNSEQPDTNNKGQLFPEVKRVGTERIDGHTTVKYAAIASDEAVVAMMDNIADVLGTQLSTDQINQIRQSAEQVQEVPVEVWVDRFTSNLRQITAKLAVPNGNTVSFTLLIRDRNKAVEINIPENTVPLQEAIRRLQATTPVPAPTPDATPAPAE